MSDEELEHMARSAGLLDVIDDAYLARGDWLPEAREFAELLQSAEREACVRVVESFLDPEIDSNTSYADEVCDGLLRQVIEAMRARHVDAASLHGSAADV